MVYKNAMPAYLRRIEHRRKLPGEGDGGRGVRGGRRRLRDPALLVRPGRQRERAILDPVTPDKRDTEGVQGARSIAPRADIVARGSNGRLKFIQHLRNLKLDVTKRRECHSHRLGGKGGGSRHVVQLGVVHVALILLIHHVAAYVLQCCTLFDAFRFRRCRRVVHCTVHTHTHTRTAPRLLWSTTVTTNGEEPRDDVPASGLVSGASRC